MGNKQVVLIFNRTGADTIKVDYVAYDEMNTQIVTEQMAHLYHDSHGFEVTGTYTHDTWTTVVNKDFNGYFKGLSCVLKDVNDTGDFDVAVYIDGDEVEIMNPKGLHSSKLGGGSPTWSAEYPTTLFCWDTTTHLFGVNINFYSNPIRVHRNLTIKVKPYTYNMDEYWTRYWFCADDPNV